MRPSAYVCSAAAAGLILAAITTSGHGGGGILPASMASAPGISSGGSVSQQQWARDFLAAIREPGTPCNQDAIVAWEQEEGGGVTNDAAYNPLNTAKHEPGSWPIPGNPDDVQAYPSYAEGLQANTAAITNGLYGGILSALSAGDNAAAVAAAVDDSPWGTHGLSANC